MSEFSRRKLSPREMAVTVHIPADILGNLETFQKVQASVFDRFGCGNCNSGIQIDWKRLEDELVVSPDLELHSVVPGQLQIG